MNKTIQELEQITLTNDDLFPIWDTSAGDTKKGSVSDIKSKIIGTVDTSPNPNSQNLINSQAVANSISYCHSSNTVVNGSPLFNGCVVKIMFTENITGSDTTTPLSITYNETPITVKVNKNGALADLTAVHVELPDANNNLRSLAKSETEEETEEKTEEETKEVVQTRGVKNGESEPVRTTTAYLYCQAYTTLELLYNGTNFIIFGNPVVISNSDYTIYTDGKSIRNSPRASRVNFSGYTAGSSVTIDLNTGAPMWLIVFSSGFASSSNRGIAVAASADTGWKITTSVISISSDGKITIPTYTHYCVINLYMN